MQLKQVKVVNQQKLFLKWDDNSESFITLDKLRKFCPCASCAAERENQSKSYIPLLYGEQIQIKNISSVGKYAISIHWADDHNTGIFEYSFLKNLSKI